MYDKNKPVLPGLRSVCLDLIVVLISIPMLLILPAVVFLIFGIIFDNKPDEPHFVPLFSFSIICFAISLMAFLLLLYLNKFNNNRIKSLISEMNTSEGLCFDINLWCGKWIYGIVFDKQHRKIGFCAPYEKKRYGVIDFSYIMRWQADWTTTTKTSAVAEPMGAGVNIHTKKRIENKAIVLYTNDPYLPMIRIPCNNPELWSARLSAIFNG